MNFLVSLGNDHLNQTNQNNMRRLSCRQLSIIMPKNCEVIWGSLPDYPTTIPVTRTVAESAADVTSVWTKAASAAQCQTQQMVTTFRFLVGIKTFILGFECNYIYICISISFYIYVSMVSIYLSTYKCVTIYIYIHYV